MSAHHETRATTARRGGGSVVPRAAPAAAPHSAHRPADRNGHGSAVNPTATVLPPCLAVEDSPPRAAGARGRSFAPTTPEQRAALAQEMREIMAAECLTVQAARRRIGLGEHLHARIVSEHGLKSSREALAAAHATAVRNAAAANAARKAAADERAGRIMEMLRTKRPAEIVAETGIRLQAVYDAAKRLGGVPKRPAARYEADRAKREKDAATLRELVAAGDTVRGAARKMGIARSRASKLATEFNIVASPDVLRAVAQAASVRGRQMQTAARPKPNPFLTPAQQQNVNAHKQRLWGNPRLAALGPPDEDEAARLVAEFIKQRGVTVCPSPVIDEPTNFGARWR